MVVLKTGGRGRKWAAMSKVRDGGCKQVAMVENGAKTGGFICRSVKQQIQAGKGLDVLQKRSVARWHRCWHTWHHLPRHRLLNLGAR